jgi:hypothetical protein
VFSVIIKYLPIFAAHPVSEASLLTLSAPVEFAGVVYSVGIDQSSIIGSNIGVKVNAFETKATHKSVQVSESNLQTF